jgi:hypothetical protein
MCANPVINRVVPVDSTMTDAEWELRVDLAACYRLIAHFEMDDLFATHISQRVPGHEDHFLLNPYGVHFSEITASNLVKVASLSIPPSMPPGPTPNACCTPTRWPAWRWRPWPKAFCR